VITELPETDFGRELGRAWGRIEALAGLKVWPEGLKL